MARAYVDVDSRELSLLECRRQAASFALRARRHPLTASVDVSRLPIPMVFDTYEDFPFPVAEVTLVCFVPDRRNGEPIRVVSRSRISLDCDPEFQRRLIYELVRHALLHELHENYLVDGALPFDPHRGERA